MPDLRVTMQAIRPTWQLQPQRALDAHALQTPRPRPLRARPSRWGDSEPLLVADLGHLELAADVAYGSQQRRDLELQVSRALLTHFGPHLAAVVQRGTPGAADRRLECWFDTVPAAAAARHAAAEDQLVRLRAVPSSGDVAVPVQLSAGRLHCQHTCILLHGLPYEYCTEGLTQILLDCAGCPRDTYTVRGEFFGDLAGELAAGSHLVGNGSACLAYIQTPDDDRHLGRLPKHFIIDGDTRINITRPGQMRQPCQPTSLQADLSASQPAARAGPRPIRQRQRAAAQARSRGAHDAQPAPLSGGSPQLQDLEARVHASQVPGSGHSGLGHSGIVPTAVSRRSQRGPRFQPARDTQPAAPMDCTPPIGAEVLPPLSQAPVAMEVEVPPPPSPPVSDSPMECASPSGRVGRRSSRRRVGDTAPTSDMDCDEPAATTDSASQPPSLDTGPGTGQPHASSLQPLELSGVPSTRIEECLAWLASHTHFAPAQTTAALRSLYDQQPLMLQSGGDTFAACEARHDSLCEILRTIHGADSLPQDSYGQSPLTAVDMAAADEGAAAPSRQRNRPAIPPGFEPRVTASIAAQHAAQVALTGLSAVRRSARIRQPAGKWWTHQPPQEQVHRNRITGTRTYREGLPGRRPSQP